MRIRQILFGLTMLFAIVSNLNAQVTFGSLEKPSNGALLQLKNIDGINDGSANANKGLMMPKVELTSITDLFPMFPTGYKKEVHDIPHAGLAVYNVNENLIDGDGAGLYIWDGAKWYSAGLTPRTISATPTQIYLSEVKHTANVVLTTTPENLGWSMTTRNDNTSSSYRDNQNTLEFTRGGSYGNKRYTFTLDYSTKHVDVDVAHLQLSLNKSLFKVGENGTVSSSSIVIAEGGDADWYVKEYTTPAGLNWSSRPRNVGGSLSFALGSILQSGTIEATITVAHVNEPELTKVITIQQNKDYILLPEFDYLVIQYRYAMNSRPPGVGNVDLDTATEFSETGMTAVDKKPVGWALSSTISAASKNFLFWPGDNTTSGYESVYANMTILRDEILPADGKREFNVDMYATWFNPTATTMANQNKISINITLYRGGTMHVINTWDYENRGGKKVFELDKDDMPVTTYRGVGTFRNDYTKMLRLEYDRIDNTGVLAPLKSSSRAARMLSMPQEDNFPEMKPNETKIDYGKRIQEYRLKFETREE